MQFPVTFFVPGRINLLGEHIDYSGGTVLPAAIDMGIHFKIRPSKHPGFRISSKGYGNLIELSHENLDNHPWLRYFLSVLQTAPFSCHPSPIQIELNSTLPSGYGLSSSTALTCGFAHALCLIYDQKIPNDELIQWTVQAEQGTGTRGGQMDQHAVLFGKKGHITALDCSSNTYDYIPIALKQTELFLLGSGITHELLYSPYNDRRMLCDRVYLEIKRQYPETTSLSQTPKRVQNRFLSTLPEHDRPFVEYIWEENNRAIEMVSALKTQNEYAIGPLLSATHRGLSSKYQVSLPEMDSMVDFLTSMDSVYGARMMGGGFGGSILVQCALGLSKNIYAHFTKFCALKELPKPNFLPFSIADGLLVHS